MSETDGGPPPSALSCPYCGYPGALAGLTSCPACGRALPQPAGPTTNIDIDQHVGQVPGGEVAGAKIERAGIVNIWPRGVGESQRYVPPPLPPSGILPEPGPLPPGSRLPLVRNALFTGRDEILAALARVLLPSDHANGRPTLVEGMGGVGKTQLAVELAYRYGRYFHGVHWVNASQPAGIGAEVAACGEAMGLPDWPATLPEQLARTVQAWAEVGPRLVVLDNLEDVRAAGEWLARLATGGTVRVLLTARRSNWPPTLGLASLPLDEFSPAESRDFLRQYLPDARASGAELDALAERLGHLPLALELAGRYLKAHWRLTVTGYGQRLTEVLAHASMQHWQVELGNPTGHDLDLRATFAVSWERVGATTARQVFVIAAYCAPNVPIPPEVLEQAAGLDAEAYDEAVDELVGLGLMELDAKRPEVGPALHPLLAEFGRALAPSLPPEGEEAPGTGAPLAALAVALARLAHDAIETDLPARFGPLRAHVEAVAGYATEGRAARLEVAGTLWDELGNHHWMVADYVRARAAHERALRIDEQTLGQEHPILAGHAGHLGRVLQDLTDLAGARAAFERALRINEQVYGPDHPDVATIVFSLATVLQDMGDYAGARAAAARALHVDEQAYGPVHRHVARDVDTLGTALRDLGDLHGAAAAHERALAIYEQIFGPEHPGVATAVNNLGEVLLILGDLDGARAAFERALRIDEQAFGGVHPNVAIRVNNLGEVLLALGDLDGARTALERGLAIREQVFGHRHRDTADSLRSLGHLARQSGDLDGARRFLADSLAIYRDVLPAAHPKAEQVQAELDAL